MKKSNLKLIIAAGLIAIGAAGAAKSQDVYIGAATIGTPGGTKMLRLGNDSIPITYLSRNSSDDIHLVSVGDRINSINGPDFDYPNFDYPNIDTLYSPGKSDSDSSWVIALPSNTGGIWVRPIRRGAPIKVPKNEIIFTSYPQRNDTLGVSDSIFSLNPINKSGYFVVDEEEKRMNLNTPVTFSDDGRVRILNCAFESRGPPVVIFARYSISGPALGSSQTITANGVTKNPITLAYDSLTGRSLVVNGEEWAIADTARTANLGNIVLQTYSIDSNGAALIGAVDTQTVTKPQNTFYSSQKDTNYIAQNGDTILVSLIGKDSVNVILKKATGETLEEKAKQGDSVNFGEGTVVNVSQVFAGIDKDGNDVYRFEGDYDFTTGVKAPKRTPQIRYSLNDAAKAYTLDGRQITSQRNQRAQGISVKVNPNGNKPSVYLRRH